MTTLSLSRLTPLFLHFFRSVGVCVRLKLEEKLQRAHGRTVSFSARRDVRALRTLHSKNGCPLPFSHQTPPFPPNTSFSHASRNQSKIAFSIQQEKYAYKLPTNIVHKKYAYKLPTNINANKPQDDRFIYRNVKNSGTKSRGYTACSSSIMS